MPDTIWILQPDPDGSSTHVSEKAGALQSYYILGSAIEAALLAAIVYYAWTWPTEAPPTSMT